MTPIRARVNHSPKTWRTTTLEVATLRLLKGNTTVRRFQIRDHSNQTIYELQPEKAVELINALADELEKS